MPDDRTRTLVGNVDGIDIFVNGVGRFTALIDGKYHRNASYGEIVKRIRARQAAVEAFHLEGWQGITKPTPVKVVGVDRNRIRLSDGALMAQYARVYVPDQAQLDRLNDIAERHRALVAEWAEATTGLRLLDERSFAAIREEQEKARGGPDTV